MTTTVVLVRHGEVLNPQRIVYGRLPGYPLSARGRSQASAAGDALVGWRFDAFFSSPQERTRETAGLVAQKVGLLPPILAPELDEIVHAYNGRTFAEMEARDWDFYTGAPDGFETPETIVGRLRAFLDRMCAAHPGGTVLGVTHGDIIGFGLLWGVGKPLEPYLKQHLTQAGLPEDYPSYASAWAFSLEPGTCLGVQAVHRSGER